MPPNQINFENFHFNPFESFSETEDERDPDEIFFNEVNTQSFVCSYLFPNEIESFLCKKENSETINAIHGACQKNYNRLDVLKDSNYSFKVLCITETGCGDSTLKNNTHFLYK